jgi:hypothetical protein
MCDYTPWLILLGERQAGAYRGIGFQPVISGSTTGWKPIPRVKLLLPIALIISFLGAKLPAQEVIVDFESAEIGKPMTSYTEREVAFELAHAPRKSKAKGRVMFFPHLGDNHKGIINAMADESIPLNIKLPKPATKVVLGLWGSTTSAALVEAFDSTGKLVAKDELKQVPVRTRPEEHVPYFTMSVESPNITSIQVSGAQPGGFVAVDELQITYFPEKGRNHEDR